MLLTKLDDTVSQESAIALGRVFDLSIRDEQMKCHDMAGRKVSCSDFA